MSTSSQWIYLSHLLSTETPGYGGKSEFQFTQSKSIAKGDSCNQQTWSLCNHIGTHIDVPLHFDLHGKSISEIDANFLIFNKVYIVTENVRPENLLIDGKLWRNSIPPECELLLIVTGHGRARNQTTYWEHGPGIHPELALWLREKRQNIRAIGFDFISVTSFQHREIGREAHQALLGPYKNLNPICAIEDMKLDQIKMNVNQVIVAPIRVANSDGSPVTILANQEAN